MKAAFSMNQFLVMVLKCQHPDTTLKNSTQIVQPTWKFSDEGKHALFCLMDQTNTQMSAVSAKEAATVFTFTHKGFCRGIAEGRGWRIETVC